MRGPKLGAADARSVRSGNPAAARGAWEAKLNNGHRPARDTPGLAECAVEAAGHALGTAKRGQLRLAARLRRINLKLRPGDFRPALLERSYPVSLDLSSVRLLSLTLGRACLPRRALSFVEFR